MSGVHSALWDRDTLDLSINPGFTIALRTWYKRSYLYISYPDKQTETGVFMLQAQLAMPHPTTERRHCVTM